MKKLSFFLTIAMVLSLLAGCAGTPVIYYTDCTCPPSAHTTEATEAAPAVTEPVQTEAPVVAEGAVKTGMVIASSISDSKNAGEENGEVKYDLTIVAVNVDDNGVITACAIDSLGTSVAFDATGAIGTDLTAPVQTKNELGENYGMVAWGGAIAEWDAQAAALANYAVGKTVEELYAGAVGETGYAQDADLATSATIYLGGYVQAIELAVANAKHLGAQAGDELKLAIMAGLSDSTAADAENAGNAQLNVDAIAMTMKEGVITSAYIDSLQAKVAFDATGAITTALDTQFATKNQLGENYGMVAWAGAIAEWDVQTASFCAFVTGKTPAEVAGIAVNEGTKPTDADLATSVTIAIGGFQALVAKAAQ